ncbi:MAG: ABC transporter permease [Candidatus Methanomethylicaceae archaeon]|nr:ABC transporter permease [Candidatus Verstraetearchaeota archaeon]
MDEILNITLLSLRVSGTSVIIGALIGIPIGTYLGMKEFRGKFAFIRFFNIMVKSIVNTFMGLPPVVVGLVVYLALAPTGPFGWLNLLYTPSAMIITQLIEVIPIIIGITMSSVSSIEKTIKERALSLGASQLQTMFLILREAKIGILTAIITAFGAAISEVGGIIITGGNIRWLTRTLTTAIVVETELGNFSMALTLGAILLTIAFIINLSLTIIQLRGMKSK